MADSHTATQGAGPAPPPQRGHPGEYERLANSLSIQVTDFFRDRDLFAYLRQQVVPDLIDHARSEQGSGDGGSAGTPRRNELRLWSAGCGTGEEAYSLAILLDEMLGEDAPAADVRIFATDADAGAIAFARRGVYPASALEHLTPAQIERYFVVLDGAFGVRRFVGRRVVFGQHDLARRAPFPQIDLALCRNVLISFTPVLQRRALQLFAFSLRRGGRLVLGRTDTASPLAEHFAVEQPRLKVFRRQGARVLLPPSSVRDAAVPVAPGPRSIFARSKRVRAKLAGSLDEDASRVTVVGPDVPAAPAGRREPAARHARQQVELQRLADEVRTLSQQARPPEPSAALQMACDILETAQAEIERLTALVVDLDRARQELLDANAEMTGANAELRSVNEDLLLSNEAAQASVEEIEALAEEQQASNEALRSTVEELNTTNDDLEARAQDLQTTALALEAERSRLAAVLASMTEAVLVVDGEGRTVLTNAAFDRVFGPGGFDFIPRDAAGHPFAPSANPRGRAARGEAFSMRFSWSPGAPAAGDDRSGVETFTVFEASGQPIAGAVHGGGVLVMRPVDDRASTATGS